MPDVSDPLRPLDWLVAAAKRTHRTDETPEVVLDAIERSEMDPKHAAIDELLE